VNLTDLEAMMTSRSAGRHASSCAASIALVASIFLSGCVGAPPTELGPTLIPAPMPSIVEAAEEELVGGGGGYDLTVNVYRFGTYTSTADSGFALPGQDQDLFPAGTGVIALRFVVIGYVPFGQADITGFTLQTSRFEGRPELAVLDQADGPAFAKTQGLPWLPGGLASPLLENNVRNEFLAAWYVPPGATTLLVEFGRDDLSSGPLPFRIPVTTAE
jgi:hypothetical protein